jgi:hypothetical protein
MKEIKPCVDRSGVSLRNWFAMRWANSPSAAKDIVSLIRWGKVVEKFLALPVKIAAGDVVAPILIDDEDLATLKVIVEADLVKFMQTEQKPEGDSSGPIFALALLPIYQCVLDAKEPTPVFVAPVAMPVDAAEKG